MTLRRKTPLRSGKGLKRGGKLKPVGERGKRRRRDYDAYMRSAQWKEIRALVLKRDGGCVQASPDCRGILTVDHISYTYWQREREGLHTLQTLCEWHHSVKDGWKHGR